MTAPADPPIFHITHVDNLAGILREGGLWSDRQRIARGLGSTNIGHRHIKGRRLECPVRTRSGGSLGDYVPFNFCPRSVMLYAVHRGHQDYEGGQEAVVHLVSCVSRVTALGRPWAFSDRHAELGYAQHFDDLAHLDQVPWGVMGERYWAEVKQERQAEFLVHDFVPWSTVTAVHVMNHATLARAAAVTAAARHQPPIVVSPEWYY